MDILFVSIPITLVIGSLTTRYTINTNCRTKFRSYTDLKYDAAVFIETSRTIISANGRIARRFSKRKVVTPAWTVPRKIYSQNISYQDRKTQFLGRTFSIIAKTILCYEEVDKFWIDNMHLITLGCWKPI